MGKTQPLRCERWRGLPFEPHMPPGYPGAEQARLEARIKELETAKTEVDEKVKRLTEALVEETKRREQAEQQSGEVGKGVLDLSGSRQGRRQ